jgi:hypothetical protein
MRKENTEKLMTDFPEMFSLVFEREHGIWPIAFGVECGDGWFDIIYNLTKKIHEIDPTVKITQIKEKFAGLRYYITTGTDEVWNLIEEAENEASKTCEKCGTKENVKVRGEGWIRTTCQECQDRIDKEREEREAQYKKK